MYNVATNEPDRINRSLIDRLFKKAFAPVNNEGSTRDFVRVPHDHTMILMLQKRSSKYLESEDGTATVESLLWFMMFMVVFFLTFDSAMMFKAETDVVRVAQDANRLASIGRLVTTADTEAYVENRLSKRLPNANATTTISFVGVIRTVVEIPASDVGQIGWFAAFRDLTLTVSAEHLKEDFL